MAKKERDEKYPVLWQDRVHHLWFPISFTKYTIKKDRLFRASGFFTTQYDETLLYRIIDIQMRRTFGQKIFGTGDVILYVKVDKDSQIVLHNIKKPMETKEFISDLVEANRKASNVVGKEFFGPGASEGPDMNILDADDNGVPDFME